MPSLTLAKAIYSTSFFTTLSLGGVLANRSFFIAVADRVAYLDQIRRKII